MLAEREGAFVEIFLRAFQLLRTAAQNHYLVQTWLVRVLHAFQSLRLSRKSRFLSKTPPFLFQLSGIGMFLAVLLSILEPPVPPDSCTFRPCSPRRRGNGCRNPSRRFLPSWNCIRARSSSTATNRVCCFRRQRAVHKAFACPKSRFLSTPPPSPFHLPGRNLFIFFPHRCALHPAPVSRNPESKTHCCYPCSRPFLLPKTQKTAASSSLAAVSM